MDAGELVPDAVIIGLVRERLAQPDGRKGFVLDGFPRTAAQAEALDQLLEAEGTPLDRVVLFEVADEEPVARLSGRRVCRSCGRNYHVTLSPPRARGPLRPCGGELYQRTDDEEATVRRRLAVYARDTRPLVDYYRQRGLLTTISGGRHDGRGPRRPRRRRPRARGDRAEVARPDRPHAGGRPDPGRRLPDVPRPGEAGRLDARDRSRGGGPDPGAQGEAGLQGVPGIPGHDLRLDQRGGRPRDSRGAAPAPGGGHHRARPGGDRGGLLRRRGGDPAGRRGHRRRPAASSR